MLTCFDVKNRKDSASFWNTTYIKIITNGNHTRSVRDVKLRCIKISFRVLTVKDPKVFTLEAINSLISLTISCSKCRSTCEHQH